MSARSVLFGFTAMLAVVAALALSTGHAAGRQDANGGGTQGSIDLHRASALTLAVSPDRHTIVMNFLGNLWTLPAAGGKATRVSDLMQDTAYPDWSPDGRTIAFQSYKSGTFHIWAMNPDGSNVRQLTDGYYDDREPMYSPDGTKIAFSSDRPPAGSAPGVKGGSYNVWVLTLATGQLTQITHAAASQSDYYPSWTPDGSHITYVNTTTEIDSIAADGSGTPQVLHKDTMATLYSPTWSPDGKHLAYVELVNDPAPSTRLVIDGNVVSGSEDVFPFAARWTSSDTVVYAADGQVKQRTLGTADASAIPFTARVDFKRPAYRMKRHDFDSRAKQQVRGVVSPQLSPDGKHVAFIALNQVWDMRLGHKPQQLTHDRFYKADVAWSPDGRSLAYSSDRDGPMALYIRSMATGRTHKLTAPFTGAQAEAAWSPDGRRIAFQSAVGNESQANTYVADVASGSFKQVLGTQFEPGRPTWGPDSTTLAMAAWRPYSNRFREGTSEILTVNADTGATNWINPYDDPYETINNRLDEDGPVWSPDGGHIAYVLDDVLWTQPVGPDGTPTGPAKQLTREAADEISWSGDSQHILYNSDGRLRLIAADGGVPAPVAVPLNWRPSAQHGVKVIHAGALWDGTGGDSLRHDVDIVVKGNRIASVGPAKPRGRYGHGVRYVDASDLTVLPGLWDAHMHEQLDQPYAGGRRDRMELAFGITSAMSMGDPAYPALEEAESQQSGARPGPRYFWAAEPVDGTRIYYNFMRATDNKRALGLELGRIGALHPDILKTYVRLPNDLEGEAIAAGHRLGIPSFSHYFWPALALGQDGTSHWATQRLGYQIAISNDNVAYDDTIQLYAKSGMSFTNTPFFGVSLFKNLLGDPRLTTLLAPWQYAEAEAEYAAGPVTPPQESFLRGWAQANAKIIDAGGTVLAGTDTPIGIGDFGSVVAMGVLSKSGLSNLQVLRSATVAPAKVMGVSKDLGTIEPGKLADMIMVRGNPLQDMNAISDDVYVMQNGRLWTQRQLLGPYTRAAHNQPPAGRSARAARAAERRLLRRGHVRLTTPGALERWNMWAMGACMPASLIM